MWTSVLKCRGDKLHRLEFIGELIDRSINYSVRLISFVTRRERGGGRERLCNLFDMTTRIANGTLCRNGTSVRTSILNVRERDNIRRGGTRSCTEGHSRDSTAIRWKYAFRSGPDLSRASRTLTAQSVKGDWACYSADAPALSVAEHWREPARKRRG